MCEERLVHLPQNQTQLFCFYFITVNKFDSCLILVNWLRSRPILFVIRMITDRTGLHSVLLPLTN